MSHSHVPNDFKHMGLVHFYTLMANAANITPVSFREAPELEWMRNQCDVLFQALKEEEYNYSRAHIQNMMEGRVTDTLRRNMQKKGYWINDPDTTSALLHITKEAIGEEDGNFHLLCEQVVKHSQIRSIPAFKALHRDHEAIQEAVQNIDIGHILYRTRVRRGNVVSMNYRIYIDGLFDGSITPVSGVDLIDDLMAAIMQAILVEDAVHGIS